MEEKKCTCSCLPIWLSGFFALIAIVHIVRLVCQWPVVIDGWHVPMSLSVVVAIAAGIISGGLLYSACRKCECCNPPKGGGPS